MELITKNQLAAIHTLLHKLDMMEDKKNIVTSYSNGRTTSSKELSTQEAKQLINNLKKMLPPSNEAISKEKMKRKIIGMAHEIGWEISGTSKIDMDRLNNWCVTSSYLKKPFDKYKTNELPKLVSQFERVYEWNLRGK